MIRLAFVVVFSVLALTARAEDMAATMRSWRNSFVPADPTRLPLAQTALQRAMDVLEPMIAKSESEAYWREQLHWKKLRAMTPGAQELADIYQSLFFSAPGMEFPQVARYREAVAELGDAVYFATLKDGAKVFQQKVDELADLIPKYEAKERAEDRIKIARLISWFERGRQIAPVIEWLRRRYDNANSIAQFSFKIVEKYAMKPVTETKQGTHTIQGTPTHSTSTVKGKTYAKFLESATTAEIEVGMTGEMEAYSVGTGGERGVTVTVSGVSRNYVHVAKRLSVTGLSEDKVISHRPTATVQPLPGGYTQIQSSAQPIMPRLPRRLQFVRNTKERIGYETAMSRLPAGQAEGRMIAAGELVDAANGQKVELPPDVKNVTDQFQQLIKEFIELEQKRKGVYPRVQWLSTDPAWLYLKHVRGHRDELAALSPAPRFRGNDHQIGIRMHESEVTNTLNRQISNGPLRDSELQQFARSILNYVPAILRIGSHAPRWSARWLGTQPVAVDFEDGDKVSAAVRFAGVDIADKKYDTPFVLRVLYKLEYVKDEGPMLKRVEEATIEPLNAETRLDKALVYFVLPRAQAFFKEELHFDGLTPVRGGIFEPLTKLLMREYRAEKNWLIVGLDFDGDILEILKKTPSGLGGDDRVK